ncbi:toxin MIT1-like isoform X2 [Branchiostoma lanceolatum]|uniref:toxin MIT1-like isoform X2 n=1 Tax=Branchiostoma lanceolatum TaxID=7740 RepID=UPI0034535AF9
MVISPYLLLPFLICSFNVSDGFFAMHFFQVCESDRQCIQARGQKSCCAPLGLRDLFSGIPVCKPMGLRGDRCHIAGDYLPYPLDAPRRFWRCPCADGLSCLAPKGSLLGRCDYPHMR